MAMAAVNFVLVKIEETILKEGELLGGVGVDVNWLKRELRHIQCFLCDADSKCRRGDARAVNWLNEVRDVAYRINDAIDIFLVESNRQKDLSFKEKLKRMWREPKELHKLAIELGNLKKMFEGIMERRINYGIELAQDIMGRSDTYMNMMPYRRTTYQNVDETQVVGLDADRNKILELLRDEKMRRRAVITIVGPGGIGKTTLACMVYKSAMRDFEYHIMLPVSQQFSQKDLLLKMVTKFDYNVPDITETDELILKLREKLGRSKYLIILDDVWNDGLCHLLLEDILPDSKNGSRVLMTSRSIYVAISADCRMSLYKLDFLNDKESRDLLFKKTFFYQELDEEYPNDLLEIADALSKRCKGLPLALIVLGGILSTKDHTYIAWERVLRTMNWQLDGRDCMDVLAMSYDDMSFDLKICFLYLAFFPEDYKISSKRLIKMWIAEGFIPHGGKKSMEEIAEDYLEELLQRNMVEASSRYSNGSIRECRVPGLLYDLAMHKAEQENFVTILPKSQHINHPDRAAYRASLQSCNSQLFKYVRRNAHSLLFFLPKDLPEFNEFRLLKVLEIIVDVDIPGERSLMVMGLDRLFHLKYLGIRDWRGRLTIPVRSLGSLKNLETLDLQVLGIGLTIPLGLWAADKLWHAQYNDIIFEALPPNTEFTNLQTLKWVTFDDKPWSIDNIPRLPNLRSLGLWGYSNWDVVVHLLETLVLLISLEIRGSPIPNEIVYPKMLPNYENLQTLSLDGKWSPDVILEASSFPAHLIKLTLWGSNLLQDPMEELGKLTYLMVLKLRGKLYRGKQMICQAGFPELRRLVLDLMDVEVFKVAEGVMPNLKYLKKNRTTKVEMPPELKHLTDD